MPSGSEAPRNDEIEHLKNRLRVFYLLIGILVAVGLFNVYSSTVYMNIEAGVNPYSYVIRHVIYLVIGLAVLGFVKKLKPESLGRISWVLCAVTVLLLLLVLVAGRTVNGAQRWIAIGPVSMQPSELAKVPAIMWAASVLAEKMAQGKRITVIRPFIQLFERSHIPFKKRFRRFMGYFKPLYWPVILALFVLKQPDMGTAGMILAFPALLYVIAGIPLVEIFVAGVAAVGLFFLIALISPYRAERLKVLWDPFSQATGSGYQTVQSLIAVGSGGFFGQGLGQGFSKYAYLPEQHTDFAFAVLSQETGFIGALVILAVFVGIMVLGLRMSKQMTTIYRMLLVSGISLLLGVQGLINMAMVVGSFPVTGIPLPFISFGGTSLIANLAAVGLLAGAVKYSIRDEEMKQRRRLVQNSDMDTFAAAGNRRRY